MIKIARNEYCLLFQKYKIKKRETHLKISEEPFGRTEQPEKQSSRIYVRKIWKYRTYWRIWNKNELKYKKMMRK